MTRVQNGIEYRCSKHEGHEFEIGNEECVAYAPEYMQKPENMNEWKWLVLQSRPLLEWMSVNERVVGLAHSAAAKRVLVRCYMLTSNHKGLTKTHAS